MKINESQLKKIISESIKNVLTEDYFSKSNKMEIIGRLSSCLEKVFYDYVTNLNEEDGKAEFTQMLQNWYSQLYDFNKAWGYLSNMRNEL